MFSGQFAAVFSDAEEIPRGPFYEPLVLTDIFYQNGTKYVHLAEFFVFALNGNIAMNVTIYINADEQGKWLIKLIRNIEFFR